MNPLAQDLDQILAHTQGLWDELRGRRLFITGGTGFFGCWLLESLVRANDQLGLKAQAVVLTRSPEAFGQKAPHLARHPAIQLLAGDVRDFVFPEGGFSHIIHAATESSTKQNEEDPLLMLATTVEGTRRVLELAARCKAGKVLLTSSGAVYGRQPPELSHVPEGYLGAPDPVSQRSAYAEGKRLAELLCTLYARRFGFETKIARCFAFVGPYLPLDAHFAVGNFLRDALRGGPIRVQGDGTSLRSYLYAADLAIWLWAILFAGEPGRPYNVGSENALSIHQLACCVARAFSPAPQVTVARVAIPGSVPECYVPSTQRAQTALNLKETVPLPEAIRRTARWYWERCGPTADTQACIRLAD